TPGGKFFQAALNALAVCVFHVSILVVENNERGKSASTSQDGADRTLTFNVRFILFKLLNYRPVVLVLSL
ncbi:MAG: hypothetical protein Q8R67_04305, partial [Rhodoferax sp.]